MMTEILFYTLYTLMLFFGIALSFVFSGLSLRVRNLSILLSLFSGCGLLLLITFLHLGEAAAWKMYPVIVHVPLGILLCLAFKKRISTVIASITLAYLCCQPPKWFGLLFETLTDSPLAGQCVHIAVLLITGFFSIFYLSGYISEIFNKDTRSVLIFGSMPMIYYVFDYIMGIYTDLWITNNRIATEFLPFILCLFFILFCVVYYKEHEKKVEAERKEQIVQITVQQQAKEIDAIKKSNTETRLLRHDMRLLLDNLAISIQNNDTENAYKMISGCVSQVEAAVLRRHCENDTLNYILMNFEDKCRKMQVDFQFNVEIKELAVDEILFSSILSNALDNALNAQASLLPADRQIKLMLKNSNEKLLLSVRNPITNAPTFVDGLPITDKKGHGYGTQSIRYMTERLGGNCQFTAQNDIFTVRVII